MKHDLRTITELVFSIGGAIVLAIGTYLPWIRVRPGYDGPVPAIYIAGMSSGLEAAGIPLIILAASIIVLTIIFPRNMKCTLLTVVTGGLAILFAFQNIVRFTDIFVPALGVYMTLLGGVLLLIAASLRLLHWPLVDPVKSFFRIS